LPKAETLSELNPYYKSEWVDEYIATEITVQVNGQTLQASGQNEKLNLPQKELLLQADLGTDIAVKVQYLPQNDLKHNDPKEINFSFIVNPTYDASYVGGREQMNKYLLENAIKNIPAGSFQGWDLAAVKFTVDEEGLVREPEIAWSSNDLALDSLLLVTIAQMPCWKPAEYETGIKVKQKFALTVGNQESCAINILNTRPLPPRKE